MTRKNNPFKNFLRKALAVPGVTTPFRLLVRNSAMIFVLHRFQDLEHENSGHSPEALRLLLGYLRRRKFLLLSVRELFNRLRAGDPLARVVAFTMDDGYRDQGLIGAPIFAEFDCPVTMFLTTGFLDGKQWLWWDRVEYIFDNTKQSHLSVPTGLLRATLSCANVSEKKRSVAKFVAHCLEISHEEKLFAISRLASEAKVSLPVQVPRKYAALSWAEVRYWEKLGVSFGPHTVTHPVLSRSTDAQSAFEMSESWKRVSEEVSNPVPIFCYPNGRLQDFGLREINHLHSMGFEGAVTANPGYVDAAAAKDEGEASFSVPRFLMRNDLAGSIQCVDGIELLKQKLREK